MDKSEKKKEEEKYIVEWKIKMYIYIYEKIGRYRLNTHVNIFYIVKIHKQYINGITHEPCAQASQGDAKL